MRPARSALPLVLLLALAASTLAQVPELPGPVYVYHTYPTLTADLQALAEAHPDLVRLTSIGQSVRGLELWNVEIGEFNASDYAARPGFYLDGGHHGNEGLGIEAAYLFAAFLAEGYGTDPNATAMVRGARIYITPLLNPDGKTQDTRQNGNLVNLNRNYPFHWDERGTDPVVGGGNYAGPSAGSEPETQANMAFIDAHAIDVYVSLHTGTYDLIRPFGYAPDEPVPDEALYQHLQEWTLEQTGLEIHYANGSGESICWAYGARGIFSILLEVYGVPETERAGGSQLLGGPLLRDQAEAALGPHFQILEHLLGNAGRWRANVQASLEDLRGADATLVLRNDGYAPATNLTVAGTGLTLVTAAPATLAPGDAARLPVRLDPPSQAWVRYQRLAIQPEEGAPAFGTAEAQVEFHAQVPEERGVPGPGGVLVAAAILGAAALRGRPPAQPGRWQGII